MGKVEIDGTVAPASEISIADVPRIPEAAVRAALGPVDELEYLGDGSQGDVWRVRQGSADDVLKVMVNVTAPQRLAREIEALQAVVSPNVMQFRGVVTVSHAGHDYPAIRGEYIPGGTIADALSASAWPSERQALQATAGILRGLEQIHSRERVHRDIKPQNVGMRGGRWEDCVVLDLGVVRDLIGDSLTLYPDLVGTGPWMAPEQLRQERAVKRSDVYAVGVMLFFALARRHPFFTAPSETLTLTDLDARIADAGWPSWAGPHPIAADVRPQLEELLAYEAFERPRAGAAAVTFEQLAQQRGP